MPPKSALVAAVMGDTMPSTQTSTTKKQPTRSTPRTTTTKSSKTKSSKKTSLPPPSELPISEPPPKRNTRKKAPLLPKENWGSTASISKTPITQPEKAKGGVRNKSALQQKALVRKKQAVPKMLAQLNEQSRQAGWSTGESGKFTERWMSLKTKRMKDSEEMKKTREKNNPKKALEVLRKGKQQEKTEEIKTFNWTGLTPEIQKRIIRHLVVDPRFLVWPEKRTGREQPDLALVSKDVREQVLEVFYGENHFGVSITGSLVGKEDCSLTGLAAVNKWATTLDKKWFGMIRNWCFEYEDPQASGAKIRKNVSFDDGEEDESFVVSVQFPDPGKEQNRVSFSGPTVEIHRAACCILPGSEDFGQCVVQHTPMGLNGLIIGAMGEGQRLQADALEGLIKALRDRDLVELVAEARCEPAMVKMRKRRGAISM
ncbi:hypothetical protein HII31_12045 [Pseudocercospora fuligena]|uniref:Uncharacterized protein n=1 Tax=Pseudocercospora fuligena TaxID=685502 RepID=A0A8H6RAT8_9PEZI|nr:hypothetical protein HII31_12045 [Pseudocercospora fuligena]